MGNGDDHSVYPAIPHDTSERSDALHAHANQSEIQYVLETGKNLFKLHVSDGLRLQFPNGVLRPSQERSDTGT